MYFNIKTIVAENETKFAASAIDNSLFLVDNIIDVEFLNSKEKSIIISVYSNRSPDILYCNFHYTIKPNHVDSRALDKFLLYNVLRLSHTIYFSNFNTLPVNAVVQFLVTLSSTALMNNFAFSLGRLSDDKFASMIVSQMRNILSDDCDTFRNLSAWTISDSRTLIFSIPLIQLATATVKFSTWTSRMDNLQYSPSIGIMYLGLLKFRITSKVLLQQSIQILRCLSSPPTILVLSKKLPFSWEDSKLLYFLSVSYMLWYRAAIFFRNGTIRFSQNNVRNFVYFFYT